METTASDAVTRVLADEDVTPAPRGRVEVGPGTTVGRYRLERPLGEGGMGEVFAAFDPDLEREVAVKLVKPQHRDDAAEARARLRREAQALARLNHPHVVPVFDVGIHEDRIFVAMELVEGRTLKRWHEAPTRAWPEVLEVLLDAGRGLAAAHRAGVVHRDFKPSNVMVGADGRARVLDFGLARSMTEASSESLPRADRRRASSSLSGSISWSGSDALTEAGVVLGTPLYMAPEQFLDAGVGPATDQFAFCVTAFRMLYGKRPFAGQGHRELRASVLRGEPDPPPRGSGVPRAVWPVLQRGLRRNPSERFASMDELLSALQHGARRGRRQRGLAAVATGVVLVGAVALGSSWDSEDRCESVATRAAATWGDERRDALRSSFEATALPYADAALEEVDRRLTGFMGEWLPRRMDACEVVTLGVAPDDVTLDAEVACLERQLARVEAIVTAIEDGGASAVEHTEQALHRLPSPGRCDEAGEPRPELRDPTLAAPVAALQREIDAAETRLSLDPDASVIDEAEAILERARALGHQPLLAEAQRLRGRALHRERSYPEARVAYDEAAQTSAALGDVRGEVRTRLLLADLLSTRLVDAEAALREVRTVESLLERIDDSPRLRAALGVTTGRALLEDGHLDSAAAILQEVLAMPATDDLASTLASARSVLAIVLSRQGEYNASVALLEQELAALERLVGPDHPRMAKALGNLGSSLSQLGRLDEAERVLLRAVGIYQRAVGPDARGLETLLHNLGTLYQQQGRPEEALATLQQSIDLMLANRGPDHPALGWVRNDMGVLLFLQGRPEDAVPHLEEATRIFEASQGPAAPGMVYALGTLIQAHLHAERPERALPHIDRALGILDQQRDVDPAGAGVLRYSSAMALWEAGEHGRALELARHAARDLRSSERAVQEQIEAIETWVAEHEALATG